MSTNRAIDVYDMIAEVMVAKQDSWRNYAACRGMNATGNCDVFFPNRSAGADLAHTICADCPVQAECRNDWEKMPIAMQRHGIWYGKTQKEREREARKHRSRIK